MARAAILGTRHALVQDADAVATFVAAAAVRYPATTTRRPRVVDPRVASRGGATRGRDTAVAAPLILHWRWRDGFHDAPPDAADADRRAADVAAVLAGAEETVQAIVVADDVDEAERAERRRRKEERRKARAEKEQRRKIKEARRAARRAEEEAAAREAALADPGTGGTDADASEMPSEMDPSAMGFSEGGNTMATGTHEEGDEAEETGTGAKFAAEETGTGATIAADTEPSGGIYTPSMVPSPSPSPAPPASETTATPAAAETTTTPAVARLRRSDDNPGSDGDDGDPRRRPGSDGDDGHPGGGGRGAAGWGETREVTARRASSVPSRGYRRGGDADGGTTGEEAAVDVFVRTEEDAAGGGAGGGSGGGGVPAREKKEKRRRRRRRRRRRKGEEGEEGEGG